MSDQLVTFTDPYYLLNSLSAQSISDNRSDPTFLIYKPLSPPPPLPLNGGE